MNIDDRLHETVQPFAVQARDGDDRHAFDLRQPVIDLLPQLADGARLALHQIPFVHGDNERAAFAHDEIRDPQVLFFEQRLRIRQQDHDLGEADRFQRIADRELLQLLLDARALS